MRNIDIFDIALIKDEITSYLSTKDLAQCTQVSHSWFTWFMPALWHTIDISYQQSKVGPFLVPSREQSPDDLAFSKDKVDAQELASTLLVKHNDLIHTLTTVYCIPFITTDPSLTSAPTPTSTSTLSSAHTFRNLRIFKCPPSTPNFARQILGKTLSRSRLEVLEWTVHSPLQENWNGIDQYNRTIASIKVDDDDDDKQNEDGVKVDAEGWAVETQIQRLYICINERLFDTKVLLPLVQRSPRLERLGMHWVHHQQTIDSVADLVQNGFLPHLNEIWLGAQRFGKDLDLVKLLSNHTGNCRTATSAATSVSTGTGARTGTGILRLKSIETYCRALWGKEISQTLSDHHGQTLQLLNLTGIPPIDLYHFIGLAAGLPMLQTLNICLAFSRRNFMDVLAGYHHENIHDFGSLPQQQWACLSLRTLELSLISAENQVWSDQVHETEPGQDDDNSGRSDTGVAKALEEICLKYVLSQMGRLNVLQELDFSSYTFILRLKPEDSIDNTDGSTRSTETPSYAYLEHLAGLKNLRGLCLKSDGDVALGAAEAKWILAHWPRLVEIQGLMKWSGENNEAMNVLRTGRPWISIC
ncbi:hypothetical protein BG011_006389 [Mortierella polycephala]|uniref:F-box domain-containing protein n=1 Tax=Mortierella polycephala TaxID=41804 RepID=A0A9P6PV62_9FUNG|nr:hypothetical protein BG011_006389 [Mortierella polycephala]